LLRLGDPIKAGVPFYRNDGSDAGASYDARIGDHSDAIEYYGLGADGRYSATASDRALLVMNHEAITPVFLHRTGPTIVNGARTVAEEVLKEFYVHGVSITEVVKQNGEWTYKQDSSFNRRVHTLTEMELSGPARGSAFMITKYSKDGTRTRGTVNDCAHGYTPWGTYLACEENWAGYFRRTTATDNPRRTAKELTSMARYGVAGAGRELWATVTPDTSDDLYGRWNAEVRGATAADDYRNGPNTYGWNVEIDPFTPSSVPKKRTAMGRFAHEGRQFLVGDFHEQLAGLQGGKHLAAQCLFLYPGGELLCRLEVHVGVEQGLAHFLERIPHVDLGDAAVPAEDLERAGKFFLQLIKHGGVTFWAKFTSNPPTHLDPLP